jgi:hypothetical protein
MEMDYGDVWQLESAKEMQASDYLSSIANQALAGDKAAQRFLSQNIFKADWKSIKPKLETEGSTWYVWWMDGVHTLMRMSSR